MGDLRLTVTDVRAGLVGLDPDTRQVGVAMNETAAATFMMFTTTHINQTVTFSVCGQAMETISVQAPIETGFALSDPMDLDRATEMVAALNGQGECP